MAFRRIVLLAPLPAGRAAFWHQNVKAEELEESTGLRAGAKGSQKLYWQHESAESKARAERAEEEQAALRRGIEEAKALERKWLESARLAKDLRLRYESILHAQHQTLADEEEALALRAELRRLEDEQENASGPCWTDIGHYVYIRMIKGKTAAHEAIKQWQEDKESERRHRIRLASSISPSETEVAASEPRCNTGCEERWFDPNSRKKLEEGSLGQQSETQVASESCCKTDCKDRWFDPNSSTRLKKGSLSQPSETQACEREQEAEEEDASLGPEIEYKTDADHLALCLPAEGGHKECEVELAGSEANGRAERDGRCCDAQRATEVLGIVICSLSACTAIALACRTRRLKVRLVAAKLKAEHWQKEAALEQSGRRKAEQDVEHWKQKAVQWQSLEKEKLEEAQAQLAATVRERNGHKIRKQEAESVTLKATDFESLTKEVEKSLEEHWERTRRAEKTCSQLRAEQEVQQWRKKAEEEHLRQGYETQVQKLKQKAAEEERLRKQSEKKADAMAMELRSKTEHEEHHREQVEIAEKKVEKWMKKAETWKKKAEEEKSRRKESEAGSSPKEKKAKVSGKARTKGAFLMGSGVGALAVYVWAWKQRNKVRRAVQQNPKDADAWVNLGEVGGGSVSGTFHSPKSCFLRALKLNPSQPGAWHGLGVIGGGTVGEDFFPAYSCLVRALELNDNNSIAWYILGIRGGCCVSGVRYTKKECLLRSIALNDKNASAWNRLGECGGGTVSGRSYSKKDCHLKALEIDKEHAGAWNRLGECGGGSLRERYYNAESCFLKASSLDPLDESAQRNLKHLRLADAR